MGEPELTYSWHMRRSRRPPGIIGRTTITASLAATVLIAGSCTRPADTSTAGTSPVGGLSYTPAVESVVCDGTEQLAGHLEGAAPGEAIAFTSPLPIEMAEGSADAQGDHPVTWTCQEAEARLRWDLTATGRESGRTVSFAIVGTDRAAEAGALAVVLHGDDVACDGTRHDIGTLTGADVDERIVFTSEQTSGLQSGQADGRGELIVGWSCRPGDAGRTWEVRATGDRSGRSTTFVVRGATPQPTTIGVDLTENPFVCDGRSRPFAALSDLVPGELVSFATPGVDDLRDGRVGADGRLVLNWQCGPDGAGRTWDLTATGAESGRTVTITFTGVADPQGGAEPTIASGTLFEDPFACDGSRRPVGSLTGLLAGEYVDFESPQADSLREGRADGSGELVVNWQCDASDLRPDGTMTWDVTATGRQSQRSTTLRITGAAP